MSAVIDTNVLIFDTFEDSQFHGEARRGLDSIARWHFPDIVFHEFFWFFKSENIQLSRARLKMEEYLTNEKTVFSPCAPDDIRFASNEITNYSDYNDFVILSIAKRLELPLFTFDRELARKAARKDVRIVSSG